MEDDPTLLQRLEIKKSGGKFRIVLFTRCFRFLRHVEAVVQLKQQRDERQRPLQIEQGRVHGHRPASGELAGRLLQGHLHVRVVNTRCCQLENRDKTCLLYTSDAADE